MTAAMGNLTRTVRRKASSVCGMPAEMRLDCPGLVEKEKPGYQPG